MRSSIVAPGFVVLGFVLAACHSEPTPKSPESTSPSASRGNDSATSGSAVPSTAPSGGLAIAVPSTDAAQDAPLKIRAGEVEVSGKVQLLPHEPRFRAIDFVRNELARAPGVPAPPAAYHVAIADDVRGSELLSVLQSAGFGGRAEAFVVPAEVVLHMRVPRPPSEAADDSWARWPSEALWVDVGANALELWRVPSGASAKEEAPAEKKASIPVDRLSELLPRALDAECAKMSCSPLVVTMELEARASALLAFLEVLSARPEHRDTEPPPHALLLMSQAKELPLTTRSLRLGATSVSGRLPPEQIQAKVRQSFGKLRTCYEEGLGRDPSLKGRVTVRFVIDREGKVSKAAAAPGSTFPDQKVSDCVVEAITQLTFPKPEGGIVTVTYPIQFEPE